jgi:hypothetical protein
MRTERCIIEEKINKNLEYLHNFTAKFVKNKNIREINGLLWHSVKQNHYLCSTKLL